MGIGNRLLDDTYVPQEQGSFGGNYSIANGMVCPVKFTEDPIEYAESKDFLGMKLRSVQRNFIEDMYSVDENNYPKFDSAVLIAGMRGGKSHPYGTPILMFDGTVKSIEDIKVGEQVMGPDSKPRNVLNISRGESKLYQIKQSCAMTYGVNEHHILSLRKSQSAKEDHSSGQPNGRYPTWPDIINIPIKEYLQQSKKWKYFFRGYTAGFINFKIQPVPIDPYLLGVWLGDGCSRWLKITSADKEIINFIESYAQKNHLLIHKHQPINNLSADYTLSKKRKRHTYRHINPIWEEFKKLNLVQNKHIPQCYISNNKKIRLKVLAGIIDTDGYRHNHGYEITLANERLARDVKRLADTLGYRTNIRKKKTTCQIKDFEGIAWRLTIHGDVWEIPCLIERKKYLHNGKHSNKENYLSSLKVTSMGRGKYAGIAVDRDHLYCLVDGTITHNSISAAVIGTFQAHKLLAMEEPAKQLGQMLGQRITIQCIASSQEQAGETIYAAIETIIDYSAWWTKYIQWLKDREESPGGRGKGSLFFKICQQY